jgi:acyl carrier protein
LEALKSDLRQLLMELAALPEGFDENADLYTELGVASMKAMELLMELEDRFQVSVPDRSVPDFCGRLPCAPMGLRWW